VSLVNLALLVAMNRWLFGVPLKGSVLTLASAVWPTCWRPPAWAC
jgi:hypothetical protein